jgi:predicted 3-demethylubiquinone-9 3-methyltransferase (glyoxalase superfamily)
MPKVTPFLWFDTQAEEAATFYTSIFKNSRVANVTPGPKGTAMVVEFQLDGTPFIALNGGPHFKFTEAVSFSVACEDQEELDYFWSKLSEGGKESQCGWLKDKFGLSWQVVPARMSQLMRSPDPVKSKRVMETMLKMKKIDIAALERARDDD